MSDEKVIPDIINIPQGVLDHWVNTPTNFEVQIPITKQEMDNLYFAINNLVTANVELQQCLINYTNGQMDLANKHMLVSQQANAHALNNLRQLYTALMSNAVTWNKKGIHHE